MDIYQLVRPLLFSLDAEKSHDLSINTLKKIQNNSLLLSKAFKEVENTQSTNIMGIDFPNKVGLAAGLDKHAQCLKAFGAMGFGSIETGTVTPKPQQGNNKPRLFRLESEEAIINRMGFNSVGLDKYIENIQQYRTDTKMDVKKPIIGLNIGKNASTTIEDADQDYLIGFEKAYPFADYISVNISSPNTKNLRDLQHGKALENLLNKIKSAQGQLKAKHKKYVPFVVKIAPDNDSNVVLDIAKICLDQGVDGIIATNTTLSRDGITHKHASETGGLSGAPLTTLSTSIVDTLANGLQGNLPIIAAGGIMNGKDAKQKMDAGASLVQIYTGFIYKGPSLIHEIISEIR